MARRLGCPTANIAVEEGALIPALGVYVGETEMEGRWYPSIVCVNDGRDGSRLKLEVHLLEKEIENLEGKRMSVKILDKLRELLPWQGEEHMRQMIADDLRRAREWFHLAASSSPTSHS
jgi:riboflavin kinase/FMN adenylyltransferase